MSYSNIRVMAHNGNTKIGCQEKMIHTYLVTEPTQELVDKEIEILIDRVKLSCKNNGDRWVEEVKIHKGNNTFNFKN